MRAVVLAGYGGPEVLRIGELDDPVPGPDEILVAVEHTAVNRPDLLQRMGLYADPRGQAGPEVLGLEYAGTVAACGARVTDWQVGDPVMGIETGGCYAELLVTHGRQGMRIPVGLDRRDAAAVPEVFITAWDALVVQGGLTSGRWALVHAGASGVGTAAIQVAKAIGANIAVTCSAGKADRCTELGADIVLERSPAEWLAALQAALAARGVAEVDVVLDVVGGEEAERNLRAVRERGTVVQVGLLGGGQATLDLGLLMRKRANWVGTLLRPRPIEEKVAICRRFAAEVLPLFDSGALRPVIDRRFPLSEVADAHRLVESNATVGKVVLDVRG